MRRKHKSSLKSRMDKPRGKRNPLVRVVNQWWGRLLGAASEGTLAEQEAIYAPHKTSRDFIFSTIGFGTWGLVFPILSIVVTQLSGTELAGMFSLAFVTGTLLMYVGNYGVRTFQASDLSEKHSFSEYQINRVITCLAMILIGLIYCNIRQYEGQMFLISIGVYLYRMVDALADVYEGRLQQVDKMYLAGISQAVRSVAAVVIFTIFLLISKDVGLSSVAMAVTAVISFVVLTFPLAYMETPKSRRWTVAGVQDLFKQCFPLFIALFLYNFIDNMPKFVMEGVLSYDNQLYFNALYFPAQAILMTVGLIYKPLIVRLTNLWVDPEKRKRFDLAIVAMIGIIIVITLFNILIMAWIGIPILSFLYGVDFEQFRSLSYVMLVAGGVTAAIDFLYQAITVLRRQGAVTKLYLITFGFSILIPMLLINFTGLPGAITGYLITMSLLFVLLVSEYISIRLDFFHKEAQAPVNEHKERFRATQEREDAEYEEMVQEAERKRAAARARRVQEDQDYDASPANYTRSQREWDRMQETQTIDEEDPFDDLSDEWEDTRQERQAAHRGSSPAYEPPGYRREHRHNPEGGNHALGLDRAANFIARKRGNQSAHAGAHAKTNRTGAPRTGSQDTARRSAQATRRPRPDRPPQSGQGPQRPAPSQRPNPNQVRHANANRPRPRRDEGPGQENMPRRGNGQSRGGQHGYSPQEKRRRQ